MRGKARQVRAVGTCLSLAARIRLPRRQMHEGHYGGVDGKEYSKTGCGRMP